MLGGAVDEKLGQIMDILSPLTQGWQGNAKDVEAEIQVFAKRPVMGHGFKITVGRTDDPDINGDFIRPPDPAEPAILQDAQQFRLPVIPVCRRAGHW